MRVSRSATAHWDYPMGGSMPRRIASFRTMGTLGTSADTAIRGFLGAAQAATLVSIQSWWGKISDNELFRIGRSASRPRNRGLCSMTTNKPLQAGTVWAGGGTTNARSKPHDVDVLCGQGVALCEAGRFREAERSFRRLLEIQPNHFEALHFLGIVCSQQGNYAEALRHIHLALRINSEYS